jgi:hypothetical protein
MKQWYMYLVCRGERGLSYLAVYTNIENDVNNVGGTNHHVVDSLTSLFQICRFHCFLFGHFCTDRLWQHVGGDFGENGRHAGNAVFYGRPGLLCQEQYSDFVSDSISITEKRKEAYHGLEVIKLFREYCISFCSLSRPG